MDDEFRENKKKSNRNYWIGLISLTLIAIFVPERYSILIFLGAIWIILFEISERLMTHYYYLKKNAGFLEILAKKMADE
jgi:hypothetical protein